MDQSEVLNPAPKRIVTGHDDQGRAKIQLVDEGSWDSISGGTSKYNVFWITNSMPVDIANDESLESNIKTGSLTLPNGTVLRIVDRAPHTEGPTYRTQSLDYGIMVQGEAELVVGEERVNMVPGDVCIMRQNIHQWINKTDQWNRMIFVLIDALPLTIGGQTFEGEVGLDHIKEITPRK